ncbi:Predicted membrane protein [Bordetella trematum]|nr:Predicted membrane protein [Bordetella trematum]
MMPFTPIDPADPRAAQLRRMKRWALALLLLMLAGFVLSHAMGGQGGWAWLRAFCEAATVGALADWFAVVALFRRPLGLPIPHTAIIPNSKDRIGDNLAAFVRDHFLDPDSLLERLRVFNPAGRLARWLAQPAQARALAQETRQLAVQAIDLLDETAVRGAIRQFLDDALQRWDAARTAGDVLALLTRDGRHQDLLNAALERLAGYLGQEDVKARASALLLRFARKEWPRIIATVDLVASVDNMAGNLADRLARALIDELREVLGQPEHPVRRDYEAWVMAYIERLRADPEVGETVQALKARWLADPQVQRYVQQLWEDVQGLLRRDLQREDSVLARHLETALGSLAQRLRRDERLRAALNAHILGAARRLSGRLRHGVTAHISRTVKQWDERHLVQELELAVGRDLQYVRFNGTLVGGLIGLALHAGVLLLSA